MRIALTAPTGMLGSMVYRELHERHELVLISRDVRKLDALDRAYGGVAKHRTVSVDLVTLAEDFRSGIHSAALGARTTAFVEAVGPIDCFFHCAGVTNRYANEHPLETYVLNSALPHLLSRIYGERLIHVTTDCVYNGLAGAPYDETAVKTPSDLYGVTKALGEPAEYSLVLRTSFVGPELSAGVALMAWFFQQAGKTIQGYTNHWWNGLTTLALARIYARIADDRRAFPATGLYHLFSTDTSKYDLLAKWRDRWQVNVTIVPTEATPIDRRLATRHALCQMLAIPPLDVMLNDLAALPLMRQLHHA